MFKNDWEREAWLDGDVWLREYEIADDAEDKRRTVSLALRYYIKAICERIGPDALSYACLLYTSDAADE